ncbi:Uncharacterized protein ACO02O_01798 [Dirofilaria immitis]
MLSPDQLSPDNVFAWLVKGFLLNMVIPCLIAVSLYRRSFNDRPSFVFADASNTTQLSGEFLSQCLNSESYPSPSTFPCALLTHPLLEIDNSNHSSRESRNTGECSTLVNCATKCIEQSNFNFTEINHCIRHQCAYHCFDGSCPTCSAFITKLFRQICISGNLRKKTNFQGRCYEMFRVIVGEKFKEQFKRSGRRPAIDIRTNLLWSN